MSCDSECDSRFYTECDGVDEWPPVDDAIMLPAAPVHAAVVPAVVVQQPVVVTNVSVALGLNLDLAAGTLDVLSDVQVQCVRDGRLTQSHIRSATRTVMRRRCMGGRDAIAN